MVQKPLNIVIESQEEKQLLAKLSAKRDAESERMKRYLAMPDLSRTQGSPISSIAERIMNTPRFQTFDRIQVPEIVRADTSFDLFNFPADHPARSHSDTYYVDNEHILRTHTTIMWYYYLNDERIKDRIAKGESFGSVCHGKVYRKDEIDRFHMNVFHQMDGWFLCPKKDKVLDAEDLKEVLAEIAKAIFGPSVEYRFNPDTFPYTDPSIEMEVLVNDRWVEVVGSGIVRPIFLKNLGVDPDVYSGWAFGFGLERLAIISMELPDIRLLWSKDPRVVGQLELGRKFIEVSKYPSITRDISFIVPALFAPNTYFDLIRDLGDDLIEEVKLLDRYENAEKFGSDRVSYTYRIVYRSHDRTLTNDEVDAIQTKVYTETEAQFGAELR